MNQDPARIATEILGGISILGAGRGTAVKVLGAASKTLLGIDLADQEIPFLGEITDGLTVAAGVGSLVASAFDLGGSGDDAPKLPAEIQAPSVGGSYGT